MRRLRVAFHLDEAAALRQEVKTLRERAAALEQELDQLKTLGASEVPVRPALRHVREHGGLYVQLIAVRNRNESMLENYTDSYAFDNMRQYDTPSDIAERMVRLMIERANNQPEIYPLFNLRASNRPGGR